MRRPWTRPDQRRRTSRTSHDLLVTGLVGLLAHLSRRRGSLAAPMPTPDAYPRRPPWPPTLTLDPDPDARQYVLPPIRPTPVSRFRGRKGIASRPSNKHLDLLIPRKNEGRPGSHSCVFSATYRRNISGMGVCGRIYLDENMYFLYSLTATSRRKE